MALSVQQVSADTAIIDSACYHCGQPCEETLLKDGKKFCCFGCQTVYEILSQNDLCEYYAFDTHPGIAQSNQKSSAFDYLDEPSVRDKLLSFRSDSFAKVEFSVPAIHCISCIWLLENLQRFCKGVLRTQVNFARKRVTIEYNPSLVNLNAIASAMASVGYAPVINLEQKEEVQKSSSLVAKLAVAGFCFANSMLLSFPEYLGLDGTEKSLQHLFSYINIALAIPVIFFSAADYFKNSWSGLRQKQIGIDLPIAFGLAALFLRSIYDIVFELGPGYIDSFSGLVFFLLIGRWFQDKTYENFAFDRDYKSYFPLAVYCRRNDQWISTVIYDLVEGDIIKIRNMEVVPADSHLLSAHAYIDYSFVTGESKPVHAKENDLIYAGGRLLGEPVELKVQKKTSQGHLTSLWNNPVFQKPKESQYKRIIDAAAQGFTWFILLFALASVAYWYQRDSSQVWLILTSVLIVACPCALALAAPFTYGSMLRVLGRNGFYLKNADVIERLSTIDTIVFDKTGTLTYGASAVSFAGSATRQELAYVKALASVSTHPLSELIAASIKNKDTYPVSHVLERPGKGIEGRVDGKLIRLGSAAFVGTTSPPDHAATHVFVSIEGCVAGYFIILSELRMGIRELLQDVHGKNVALISGDNASDQKRMQSLFSSSASAEMRFSQSPHDKMEYIRNVKEQGRHVAMMGDGLNDAGALQVSDVGIAVSDNAGIFTPACDGILRGDRVHAFGTFLRLSKAATVLLWIGFGISFCYNLVSLGFAVTGHLTPLVAAILMPISSITVVGFSSLSVKWVSTSILKKS
jgi:P-type Cu+ transporter